MGSFILGFIAGFGTGVVTKDYLPDFETSQMMRGLVRGSLRAVEKTREYAARASEVLQDSWAEVQMELKNESQNHAAPARKSKAKRVHHQTKAPRHHRQAATARSLQ
jgi:hypothetical protein